MVVIAYLTCTTLESTEETTKMSLLGICLHPDSSGSLIAQCFGFLKIDFHQVIAQHHYLEC